MTSEELEIMRAAEAYYKKPEDEKLKDNLYNLLSKSNLSNSIMNNIKYFPGCFSSKEETEEFKIDVKNSTFMDVLTYFHVKEDGYFGFIKYYSTSLKNNTIRSLGKIRNKKELLILDEPINPKKSDSPSRIDFIEDINRSNVDLENEVKYACHIFNSFYLISKAGRINKRKVCFYLLHAILNKMNENKRKEYTDRYDFLIDQIELILLIFFTMKKENLDEMTQIEFSNIADIPEATISRLKKSIKDFTLKSHYYKAWEEENEC